MPIRCHDPLIKSFQDLIVILQRNFDPASYMLATVKYYPFFYLIY